jgi:BASS family bile acid:Na+ symporter
VRTALNISIPTVTVAMMVAVGMGLEARHFAEVARRKHVAAVALIGQMVLLPAIGWCIVRVTALPPHLSAGILLMAACPVGDIANFYTALARANTALSVAVNTLSCLLAAVTMTIVFQVYVRLSGERFMFAAPPLQLVARIVLLTALPIAAGMVLRRFTPRAVARIAPVIQMVCLVGIAGVITLIVVVQAHLIAAEWKPAVAASVALMTVAMAAGWILSVWMRLPGAERMTFAVIFAVRNVALSMAVAVTLLGRADYAAFAVVYFLAEVPLLLASVAIYRRRRARRELTPCTRVAQ